MGEYFFTDNQKNGGIYIPAIPTKPELQKIKSNPQYDQLVTQGHSATNLQVSFFLDKSLSQAQVISHSAFVLHKAQA